MFLCSPELNFSFRRYILGHFFKIIWINDSVALIKNNIYFAPIVKYKLRTGRYKKIDGNILGKKSLIILN